MGASSSVLPSNLNDTEVHEVLLNKFEAIKHKEEDEEKRKLLPETLPDTLEKCLKMTAPTDEVPAKCYQKLQRVYEEYVEEHAIPDIDTSVKGLPEALDTAVYRYERWPVLVDPSGQGTRFLKYQRGTFLLAHNPMDMDKENLRKCLVGALQHGTAVMINFDEMDEMSLEETFDKDHFPTEVLRKVELFREEVWEPLLRPGQGDPEKDLFRPKDDFKLIVVTKNEKLGKRFACQNELAIVKVLDPTETSKSSRGGSKDPGADEIAAAFGARDIKRNSTKLVEAAFDGEWDEIQEYLDKGYSFDSEDAHGHTPLSEAACQGHLEICQKLIGLGADPNAQNDTGRTPLFRASYNGHLETVKYLLEQGGDPRLASQLERPYDVAKTDEVRELLHEWDEEETDSLIKVRKAKERELQESRLTTAAERDAFARDKIRQELVELTMEGKLEELKERLQELADEALEHNERPRGFAEVRDDRGNTLLLIAVWKNHLAIVEFLLTHFETFDPEFDKVERKVFFSSVRARDSKGWNACALATFHGYKKILQLLLEKECDPYVKNSYNKNSFDLAQDEKDACRKVVVDKSEIRGVLLDWEKMQNPRAAAQRDKALDEKKQEEDFEKRKEEEEESEKKKRGKPDKKKKNPAGKKGNKKAGKKKR